MLLKDLNKMQLKLARKTVEGYGQEEFDEKVEKWGGHVMERIVCFRAVRADMYAKQLLGLEV